MGSFRCGLWRSHAAHGGSQGVLNNTLSVWFWWLTACNRLHVLNDLPPVFKNMQAHRKNPPKLRESKEAQHGICHQWSNTWPHAPEWGSSSGRGAGSQPLMKLKHTAQRSPLKTLGTRHTQGERRARRCRHTTCRHTPVLKRSQSPGL